MACAADTGPAPDVGVSSEALSYADNCVAKAFITTQNGAFVVGKVVGNGTSVRGHWMHLSAPIATPAPADDEGDCDRDDEGDDEHGRMGDDEHGRMGDDEHGRMGDDEHGRMGDDEHGRMGDDHGRCGDDEGDEDEGDDDDGAGGPPRHLIIGTPTSLICRPNGGFLAHVEGDAIFDGVPGHTFALQLDDLSSRSLPNQYVIVVYDAAGTLVYSDPFSQVQTGRSSVVITGPPSLPTP
ncbi:MAG: hypothetical protein GXP55_20375 [Deltaproteobacteria bacterium]|nr:hypothetical protein [Deltaproteobacteria bacterium]